MTKKEILIIGFGSQAQAWSLNLRDSGWQVKIALRPESPSYSNVREKNFETLELLPGQEVKAKWVALLTPDHTHQDFLKTYPLRDQAQVIVAHGLSLDKDQLTTHYPQYQFHLLAPKTIASELRNSYLAQKPLAGVCWSQHQGHAPNLLALAKDLGLHKCIQETPENEVVADLFSEQALLCSLLPYASKKCFDALVEKGISPELALIECFYEVELIAKTMVAKGPVEFFKLISPMAFLGGEKGRQQLLDHDFDQKLSNILNDITSKTFYKEVKIDQSKMQSIIDSWKSEKLTKTYEKTQSEMAQKI